MASGEEADTQIKGELAEGRKYVLNEAGAIAALSRREGWILVDMKSLKSFGAILELAAERRGEPLPAQFVAEAEAIALCRAGEFDPALRVIEKWLYDSSCGNQPVVFSLVVEHCQNRGRRVENVVSESCGLPVNCRPKFNCSGGLSALLR